MKIFKYTIPPYDAMYVKVLIPQGAQILSVHAQHQDISVWALVDPLAPKVERVFEVATTGTEPRSPKEHFLGTVLFQDGRYVAHVFVFPEEPGS